MIAHGNRRTFYRVLASGPLLALPALLALLAMTGCARAGVPLGEMTAEQWREDLAYLARSLPAKHGNAFHQVSRSDFEAAVAKLDTQIAGLTPNRILAEMGRIVATVGDGHTELWLTQKATRFGGLPVAFHYYGQDLHIFATTGDHADLLGRRVVAIGDVSVKEAYDRVIPLIARDNVYEHLRSAPIYLRVPEILEALAITRAADEVRLTLAGTEGEKRVTLPRVDDTDAEWTSAWEAAGVEAPLYLRRSERWYWYEYLDDSRTLYVRYDRCKNQPGAPSIKAFAAGLFDFVDSHAVERFVLDLRRNTGGNYHRNKPLIDGIRRRPKINRPGGLFVVTGRTTFSAATLAAIHLKQQTAAILAGEPSRGRPNGYSDEKHLYLPHSRIQVNYAPLYREAMPELGDAPFLPVDLAVERTFEDYRSGHDPVLAAILAYRVEGTRSGVPSPATRANLGAK